MALNWLICDFESLGPVDLLDVGASVYAQNPLTEVACLGIRVQKEPGWLWKPGESIERLDALAKDEGMTWIAFNCMFERSIWHEIMVPEYGLPPIPLKRWHDIQASAAMMGLPQNLGDLAETLHLSSLKDTEYRAALKALNKPDKAGNLPSGAERAALLELVYTGCLQDLTVEYEAHEFLGWLPLGGDRLDWLLTQKTNEMGVKLDLEYIRKCQEVVAKAKPALLAEFSEITGGLAPTQGAKYIDWLSERHFPVPEKRNAKGEMRPTLGKEELKERIGSADDGTESKMADVDADVLRSLRIRQLVGSSSISKLGRMAACVGADARSRGLLHWHGTGPGRSAGRLWQPHNLPKPTLKLDGEIIDNKFLVPALLTGDPEYVEMMAGPPIQAVVQGLRHAMVADEGHLFVSGDYAGIQARLVLAMAGQSDKTALMAAGQDVYIDMAQTIFKRPIDKHRDPWHRGIGKNSVLGLGFQMAAFTFYHKYVWLSPPNPGGWENEENQEFCADVVQVYRKEWAPKVPPVWYALEGAALECVYEGHATIAYGCMFEIVRKSEHAWWLVMTVPSGGKVWYFRPNKVYDQKYKRDSFSVQTLEAGRLTTDSKTFGGRFTENAIMRLEHDLMTIAKAKCEKEGLPVALEVHDEILVEAPEAKADAAVLKQIMLDVPEWAKKLQVPINIDCWVGPRYQKG